MMYYILSKQDFEKMVMDISVIDVIFVDLFISDSNEQIILRTVEKIYVVNSPDDIVITSDHIKNLLSVLSQVGFVIVNNLKDFIKDIINFLNKNKFQDLYEIIKVLSNTNFVDLRLIQNIVGNENKVYQISYCDIKNKQKHVIDLLSKIVETDTKLSYFGNPLQYVTFEHVKRCLITGLSETVTVKYLRNSEVLEVNPIYDIYAGNGRLCSSGSHNINLAHISSDLRKYVIPYKEENIFLYFDFNALELRLLLNIISRTNEDIKNIINDIEDPYYFFLRIFGIKKKVDRNEAKKAVLQYLFGDYKTVSSKASVIDAINNLKKEIQESEYIITPYGRIIKNIGFSPGQGLSIYLQSVEGDFVVDKIFSVFLHHRFIPSAVLFDGILYEISLDKIKNLYFIYKELEKNTKDSIINGILEYKVSVFLGKNFGSMNKLIINGE